MLSQAAFNAFLKTLEEPPSYAIFILATTEKHKILPTILSRCQIFDFNRIKVEDMANHLASIADKEGISYEQDGLHVIAQKADGGLRDALSMFDQIVSFSDRQVTYQAVIENLNILDYEYYFQLLEAVVKEQAAEALLIFDTILNRGFDGGHFMAGLSNHLRNLLVTKEPKTLKLLEVSENVKKRYLEQSATISSGLLLSAMNIANQCEINYRTSKNQRLQVELALLKMCHLSSAIKMAVQGVSVPPATEQKKKLVDYTAPTKTEQPIPVSVAREEAAPIKSPTIPAPAANTVEQRTTEAAPPKPYTPGKGWGNIKSAVAVPNLQTVFEETATGEGEKEELVVGSEYQDVTFNNFLGKWSTFAEKMKNESRITIYTIMTASTPRLDGTVIEIDVENMVQMEQIKESKIDILNYLRVELRNFALDLKAVQVEQTRSLKPYTSQEKYQAMAAKNPALETLRKTFNLGLS